MRRRIGGLAALLVILGILTGAKLDVREEDSDEFYPVGMEGAYHYLAGAPRWDGLYRDSLSYWARTSISNFNWYRIKAPFIDTTGAHRMLFTFGGTDTGRQVGNVEYPSTDFAPLNYWSNAIFEKCAYDSSEGVVMGPAMPPLSATSDAWFYAQISPWMVSSQYVALGLAAGINRFTPYYGTLFEHAPSHTWDGTINDSAEGIYLRFMPHATLQDTVTIFWRAPGAVDSVRVTGVGIASDFTYQGDQLEFAFHLQGFDSLFYYVNGLTGSVDVSGVFSSWDDAILIDLTYQTEGAGGTRLPAVIIKEMWGAVRDST